MKTYQEFLAEKEKYRGRWIRPGEPGSELADFYVAFLFNKEKYSLIEGNETLIREQSFGSVAGLFCDCLERNSFARLDINYSDNFPEADRIFLERLRQLVLDKIRFESEAKEYGEEASSLRPSAIRAANAGLGDKWR